MTVSAPSRPGGVRGLINLIRSLWARFVGLFRELGKFGVVGGVSYIADTAIFNLLRPIMEEPTVRKIISTAVGATIAFVGNRYWTWRDRSRSGLAREYPLFFLVNLVGLGITVGCLFISHNWLGEHYWPILTTNVADNISGNVIGVGFASLFRFWAYRRFVFRPDAAPALES